MKKKDIILICSIVVIAIAIFVGNKFINGHKGDMVAIYVENKLYKEIPLNSNEKIKIKNKNGENIVYIHDNGVEMLESNCKDKICVKTGFIKDSSQSIVCLPHKINVKILSKDKINKHNLDITTN